MEICSSSPSLLACVGLGCRMCGGGDIGLGGAKVSHVGMGERGGY